MIAFRTYDSVRFQGPDNSEIKLRADESGLVVTVTGPDGPVACHPLTPSDTEILQQFLGEALPMWDKDEI